MCTVTYVPTENGFIFTSSRDERYDRKETKFPVITDNLIFPQDLEAKGTWIASNSYRLACLLNGGFIKHERKLSYKKSRGLMLLDSFNFKSINDFVSTYDFEGMEPFTFICIDNDYVHELRWDEVIIHHSKKSLTNRHIWSSATLYEPNIVLEREKWFFDWHNTNNNPNLAFCRDFHYKAGEHDSFNSVMLNRETKGTISITSVEKTATSHQFIYDDFSQPIRTENIPTL